MISMAISAQWGAFAYMFVTFIPSCALEFGLYPVFPFLDVPPIPFEDW